MNKSLENVSREDMIRQLTRYELEYFFANNYFILDELTSFFTNGGFNNYNDSVLKELYNDKILGL